MRNRGVYKIQIGKYFYVGQSKDLKTREYSHLNSLKKGTHYNPIMQRAYNKYQDFSFSPLVYAEIKELNHIEQGLLDIYCGNKFCMNIAKDAEAPSRGLKRTEESLKKMRRAQKGENNPAFDHAEYTFIHEEHGEVTCTRYQLRTKYNLDNAHLTKVMLGKRNHTGGWRLKNSNFEKNSYVEYGWVKRGESHPCYDPTKYTFIHDEHGEVTCTKYELWTKYNLFRGNVSNVASGKRKSTGGWRLK